LKNGQGKKRDLPCKRIASIGGRIKDRGNLRGKGGDLKTPTEEER